MTPQDFLTILSRAAILKTTTRHCYTQENRKESVADHSWRIALMAMLLSGEPEFQDTDMNKVIRMCLIHDLGETFTGDIPSFEKPTKTSRLRTPNSSPGPTPSPPPSARNGSLSWTKWKNYKPKKREPTKPWTNWKRSYPTTSPTSPPGSPWNTTSN